ncbi:MAG TPA: hypothetical protein VD863_04915 [Bradyrhizobium sp.]|nr:hypothetical protein [Bradyrhizobium sp.]
MSSRTAKFVSAIFVGLIASAPLVTASQGAPAEADKCLSQPKGAPPAGGHWYYRVDRATKRTCWYVGDAKEKIVRTAPEASPPATDSASPPNSLNPPSSIANARAEWPSPQARVEPDTSIFTAPSPLATVAGTISPDSPRANADDAGARSSVVGARWVELAEAGSAAGSAASADNAAAGAPAKPQAAPVPSKAAPPAAAALPLTAADASSTEKPAGSVQMLLIAILGALALAGLLVSAIFRFGGPRRTGRRAGRGEPRVNWDSVRTDRPSLSHEARAARSMRDLSPLPGGSLPRRPRAADDADKRIAQLLSRPRSSAT